MSQMATGVFTNIIELCIQAISEFDSNSESVGEYISNFLKSSKDLSEEEHVFVTEVFAGCVRYSNILITVLDSFFNKENADSWMNFHFYLVLLYLIMFRFDEIEISLFQKFIQNQNVHKIHRFLKFFLNNENLSTWTKEKWCQYYDVLFVEEKLAEPLRRHKPDLDQLVLKLEEKINHISKKKLQKKSLTEPKPFDLTKLKPVFVSVPDKTEVVSKHKRIPLTYLKNEPKEYSILRAIKAENKRKAKLEQLEANEKQFNCTRKEMSMKTKMKLQQIKENQNCLLQFNMKHRSEVPTNAVQPIKMTSAAVFREADLFRKQKRQETKKIDVLSCGDHEAQRRKVEDQKEWAELSTEVRRKWVQGKLNREGAMLARQVKAKRNRETVRHYKKVKEIVFEEYQKLQEIEKGEKKKLIKQLNGIHEKIVTAKQKTVKENRKAAQHVNAATNEMMKKARIFEENQTLRKALLLRQKHSVEHVSKSRKKIYDSTSVPERCSMFGVSLAETRERLCRLKESQRNNTEEKRDSILKAKLEKTGALIAAASFTSAHRTVVNKMAQKRAEEKYSEQKLLDQKLRSDCALNALRDKLKGMTEQRMKISKELGLHVPRDDASNTENLIRISKQKERQNCERVEQRLERQARRAKVSLY